MFAFVDDRTDNHRSDRVSDILSHIVPFCYLNEDEIKYFLNKSILKKYKKSELLVVQGDKVEKNIRLVVEGSAKVYIIAETGDEVIVDYRCAGDIIGLLSIATEDSSLVNVEVVDDIICYELHKDDLYYLFSKNYKFLDGFLSIYVKKYLIKVSSEFKQNALYYGSIDRMFFTTLISFITKADYPKASKNQTLKDAANVMVNKNYSAIIVVEDDKPIGIITDKDFRKKVIAKGIPYDISVSEIMSSPVYTIESDATCFEAIVKMISLNINHLVVINRGKILGIVDSESLMNLQTSSPLAFAKEIELKKSLEDLSAVSKKVIYVSSNLYKMGLRAENITTVVSELNDRLLRRIIDLGIEKFGKPPVNFCWIAMGSEGRKEQTFKTDQDNGIIYDDPDSTIKEDVSEYFYKLAEFVNDGLIACGFPPCPGNYMAKNPEWCQPLSVWKRYFEKYFASPTSDAVLKGQIIFDFRGVYGDVKLSYELRRYINNIHKKALFINFMAKGILNYGSALTFFGSFVTEKKDDGEEYFDIKKRVLAPIVAVVRLFAIEGGVMSISTLDRINDLINMRYKPVLEYHQDIEQSFRFLLDLRMKTQIYQYISGKEVNNFIPISKLSSIENRQLKIACQLLDRLHESLKRRYGL